MGLTDDQIDSSPINDRLNTFNIIRSIIMSVILLFTVYTLSIEIRQMYKNGFKYFHSIWNALDLSACVSSPLLVILDMLDMPDEYLRPVISITVLIFFLRLFYFLRIFDSTSYIVRIIIEITLDIKIFILVLFVGVAGFGFSFYILSNNN